MFAYINDLTAYLIIKEIAAAVTNHANAERASESEERQSYDFKDAIRTIIDALPGITSLVEAANAPKDNPTDASTQQPATPKKVNLIPLCPEMGAKMLKTIVWDFLKEVLTPEQLGKVGRWMRENETATPTDPTDPTAPNDPTDPNVPTPPTDKES